MGTFDYICKVCGCQFEYTSIGLHDEPYCECGSTDLIKLFALCANRVGLESVHVYSDRYIRPDKPPNPAKMWKKFGTHCADLEAEGKTPKVDDNIGLSVKAWENAGYEC